MTDEQRVRHRLVEAVHADWIVEVELMTNWPHDAVVETLIAGGCDPVRLRDEFDRFRELDNQNPFVKPPVHVRFLKFLQRNDDDA
jgi:hypothetical protein